MARPTAADNRRAPGPSTGGALRPERPEPVPSRIPANARHFEVAIATAIWIVFLPLVLVLTPFNKVVVLTAIVILLVLKILLMVHSCTLRPFYTETRDVDEHDEYGEMWVIDGPMANQHDDVQQRDGKLQTNKELVEECKLVFLCMLVLSSVGCAISLTSGGAVVFRTWAARSAMDCSVARLGEYQRDGYGKFSCTDGYVDFDHQLTSLQREHSVQGSTYVTYNMAPVYEDPDSAVPVAWAVAKNMHLDSGFQSHLSEASDSGLYGIIVSPTPNDSGSCNGVYCLSEKDNKGFHELKHAFIKNLQAREPDVDLLSIPTVELTNLSNPRGNLRHFIYAIVLYSITLVGLVCMQIDYIKEDRSRPPTGPAAETRYEALQGGQ